MIDDPAGEAAQAVKHLPEIPEEVLEGQPLAECECGERFEYGHGTDIGNLDPCPSCGTQRWEQWGYRLPDGGEVAKEVIGQ